MADVYRPHVRERSRSPRRRSRSPRRRRSYSSRSPSRNRDDYRRSDRRSRSPGGYGSRAGPPRGADRAGESNMSSMRDASQQERRVYVGNLSYDVKWHHLKDFMRQAGEVLYADVLLLPNGMSKGCGIVEYATRDQAQNAVTSLSNQNLMGRLVYVREDREAEPRFGSANAGARGPPRGGYEDGAGGGGRQIYIANLPYDVAWQDLKDLFRQATSTGVVVRADVLTSQDGSSKGSGIVAFETADDARNAIAQFNGYDWNGRVLEVREDRMTGGPGRGGYGRGGFGRGGFGGGRGGFGGRGGYGGGRGGYGGGYGGDKSYDSAAEPPPPNPFTDDATSGGERNEIIYVRNLPWSTSNDDLVELFQTIGKVDRAEIQYEPNGRSRGTGVVQFDTADNADTAISKFTGYQYGGRPLGISFAKYLNAVQSGEAMEGTEAAVTQDQIM